MPIIAQSWLCVYIELSAPFCVQIALSDRDKKSMPDRGAATGASDGRCCICGTSLASSALFYNNGIATLKLSKQQSLSNWL